MATIPKAPTVEAPKTEAPKTEAPKTEAPKTDVSKLPRVVKVKSGTGNTLNVSRGYYERNSHKLELID